MAASITIQELQQARGADVLDPDGEKVGKLEDIYYDDASGQPEWIGVTSGMIGKSTHVVPLEGAQQMDGGVRVAFGKDRIEETPEIDSDQISPETETEIYRIYGLQTPAYSAQETQAEMPDQPRATDEPMAGRTTDTGEVSTTLHEEEANIGKRRVPAGTARLRKWVETDTVEQDVALERDRAEVHREPVNESAPGAELREETAEMELGREEPVVEKETRATERVGLERETDVEHEDVSARVGKEHAEVETDADERTRSGRNTGL